MEKTGAKNMISITICDDSKVEIERLLVLLKEFDYKKDKISIQTFNSSINLVKAIESGNVSDIYLLDIVMPGLSGIDIGSFLRERNKDVCIIFFTNSTEFALNAFEVSALQYLLKPVKKSALFSALNKAIKEIEGKDKFFILDLPDGKIPIKHKDIIYVEYNNHVMIFQTLTKTITSKYIRVPFNIALTDLLKNPSFIQSHRAYVINMQHVRKMNKKFLLMAKSHEIPIAKSHLNELTELYTKFILGDA
jgi:DNA-binding LytR/AlgR family response regulator